MRTRWQYTYAWRCDEAQKWLLSVADVASLNDQDIFVVPGNHDVQRKVDKRDQTTCVP